MFKTASVNVLLLFVTSLTEQSQEEVVTLFLLHEPIKFG